MAKATNSSRSARDARGRIDSACRQAVAGKLALRELARWVDGSGVSETEFRLLWLLFASDEQTRRCARSPLDQCELAKQLAVSPAQVSGVVERLRTLVLVERVTCQGDRRRQCWQLTTAGRALILKIVAAVDAFSQVSLAGKGAA
jgi:DNA-binding MarR family transcriptional regulator